MRIKKLLGCLFTASTIIASTISPVMAQEGAYPPTTEGFAEGMAKVQEQMEQNKKDQQRMQEIFKVFPYLVIGVFGIGIITSFARGKKHSNSNGVYSEQEEMHQQMRQHMEHAMRETERGALNAGSEATRAANEAAHATNPNIHFPDPPMF